MPHKHAPGLTLPLDPIVRQKHGATYSCDAALAVEEQHFFVCIEASATDGFWVPLYSEDGDGREEIPPEHKDGHYKWANSSSYFHPAQVWRASHKAVQLAAKAGHDKSTPKAPNTVKTGHVPDQAKFPH